jgi:hypothetical protein
LILLRSADQQVRVGGEGFERGTNEFGAPSAGTVACGAAMPTAERSSMICS